jgi:hypothetical protein
MREEKIVWMTWREEVERYLCPHEKAATLMSLLLIAAHLPAAQLAVLVDGQVDFAAPELSVQDVADMLDMPPATSEHEHEIAVAILNDKRLALCAGCFGKAVTDEDGRWAIVTRDTGEVLRAGDQIIDQDRLRHIVMAELAGKERR